MKSLTFAKVIVLSVCFATLLTSIAQAGPRSSRHKKSRVVAEGEEERYVVVTGSHIPQKVKVNTIGTTTPYNLRVYSRHQLDSTGRATPGEALRALDPSIQLSGR